MTGLRQPVQSLPAPVRSVNGQTGAVITGADWVNVKARGAVGDGVTDDTAAINTAISSVAAGTLFFPDGTYVVSGLVAQNLSGFTLTGGRAAKVVMAGNTSGAPNRASANILTVVNCTDFAIENITFDGRRDTIAPLVALAANAAAGQPAVQVAHGVGANYLTGQRLNLCGGLTANGGGDVDKQDKQLVVASVTPGGGAGNDTITFTTNLANAYTAGGAVVSDAYGPYACNGAYLTSWQTGAATIAGRLLVEEDQQQGIHLIRCSRFRISGVTVRNVWESPIRCGTHLLDGTAQADGCTDGQIVGNLLYHGYDQGVGLWLSKQITVADNTIISTGWAGVCMTVSDYCTVTGNTIDGAAQQIPGDSKAGHGVAVEGGVGNVVATNVVVNSTGRGVYLTAAGTHPFGGPAQVATTVAGGSDAVALPTGTVNVASTTGFATAGIFTVLSSAGAQQVTYTGKTGTSFTGCSAGTGTLYTGQRVVQYPVFLSNGAALQIGSTTASVSDGTKFQVGGRYSIVDGPRTERVQVAAIATNLLTFTAPTKYRHADGSQLGQAVTEGTVVTGNSISGTGDAGIGLSSAVGTVIKGNRIDRAGLRGIDMVTWTAGGVQPPCNTLAEGNSIHAPDTSADGAAYQAIGVRQVTDFQVVDNETHGALATTGYFTAIGVQGCSAFQVAGNKVGDGYAIGIQFDPVNDWTCRAGQIRGNQVTRCFGEGLRFLGGRELVVEGNLITGSAANNGPGGFGGALNIRGVQDSIFAGNTVFNNGRGVGLDDTTIQGVNTVTTNNLFVGNLVADDGKNYDPFNGAATQQNFGFKEFGTAGTNTYADNRVFGNTTNWSISGSGNNKTRGNQGYNPVGKFGSQPAVPASGVTQVNDRNADATVYVAGGTVTAITVAGQATGVTAGAVRVLAGQTIAVTYSVTPTWVWFGD